MGQGVAVYSDYSLSRIYSVAVPATTRVDVTKCGTIVPSTQTITAYAVAGAQGYMFKFVNANDATQVVEYSSGTNSFTFAIVTPSLTPGATYNVSVEYSLDLETGYLSY
jgi:hypothetical protein